MASVKLTNLRKSFGAVHAVDGINLDIQDGEFVALLGPSGCGKTTTLRMISGLEVPTGGTIYIGDRDVTSLPPRDRDVAMVFQDYALYPHMTIDENIGYPLKVRGVGKDERASRVREVADNLQIGGLLERRPAQLSGGQQQRTALARAVVYQARVFLFDEPLSNLDAKLRLEARAFLKHLQQEVGVTGVYVTHDQSEAMALADRIVIMSAGKIMQVGTPLEIYRRPANTFVASFIGNPPMNLLPCSIDAAANKVVIAGDYPISAASFNLPKGHSGSLTLGIRPEHIRIETSPTDGGIAGQLYVVQTLGSESLVVVHVGDHLLSVRLFGDEVPVLPHDIWLVPDYTRAFFYDKAGELML
ncbi:MAG: ABC transporter ATP-binding protein [Anaerolineae bacterium]